jgi:flagellar basal-body rod protein FlgC
MTNMLIAQRSYQANLSVMDRARDAYKAALSIGVK